MRIDASNAEAILGTAIDEGFTIFDTARAYGASEHLLGEMLRGRSGTVITKGGMHHHPERPGLRAWEPDGRARVLREDCEASLRALDRPIDLYLVHAPDPRVPWKTTVRALARLLDEKLVGAVGLSNVNRAQLDEALTMAPIAAVQVAFGPARRGGVLARCQELGITVFAHSPLGGPARAKKLAASRAQPGATPQETVLASLRSTGAIPVVGATRAETVRSIARSTRIEASPEAVAALELAAPERIATERTNAEVVMIMGLQGSGKSSLAARYQDALRLNRDLEGGTMKTLHTRLAEKLRAGSQSVVMDNIYVTRASRHEAITTAHKNGARVKGVFVDVKSADAQINIVLRMLRAHGRLLEPEEMEASKDPTTIGPSVLFRTIRMLEQPSLDEGFDELEIVPFQRARAGTAGATFISVAAPPREVSGLRYFFGWKPGERSTDANIGICPHEGGPPRCWCRPPLPGLLVAWALAHDVDFARSTIIGTSAAHRTMANALGTTYVDAST
jgi:aryl-alcohol dehydrogenase-like predicted oxidoreductase